MIQPSLWICALLFLLAAPLAAQTEPAAPVVLASRLIEQLVQGDFTGAVERFNDRLKVALPPDKLAAAWKLITEQAGPFKKLLKMRTEKDRQYDVVIITCAFEKANLDAKVAYDAQQKVASLLFSPAVSSDLPSYIRPASYREEDVQLPGGLPGTLAVPTEAKVLLPAVVLLHGSGPGDRDQTLGPNKPFRDIALGLASRGIASLRYDKRTRVRPEQFQNATYTVREEVLDDARSALALLRARTEVDRRRLFVLGHSLGGMLLPRLAREEPEVAGLIVLAGPARPFADVLVGQLDYLMGFSTSEEEKTQLAVMKQQAERLKDPGLSEATPAANLPSGVPGSYWLDLRAYDPPATARTLQTPMLILQGERDYQVTRTDFELWKQVLAGRSNVKFNLYSQLNHLFMAGEGQILPSEYLTSSHVAQVVIDDLAKWITSSAGKRP
ncbi:MAG: alpha/beta fold hydrolase [Aphanocapsa lilacina HA4352-LM1]|jgi:dienelactone hydrolase|nr:alpha/beta fold hydrolase [Aphanocapsa lilacina HA4352-LM1]